jgi:hypothetical protein
LDIPKRALLLRSGCHHLDPITGRENHSLFNRRESMETPQGISQQGTFKGNLFPHLDWSGAVIEPNDDDLPIHDLTQTCRRAG